MTWYHKTCNRIEKASSARTRTLCEMHDLHVAVTMQIAGGNISEAARLLDVDRRSLQRKIMKIKKRGTRP